jgi:hypothetical protein
MTESKKAAQQRKTNAWTDCLSSHLFDDEDLDSIKKKLLGNARRGLQSRKISCAEKDAISAGIKRFERGERSLGEVLGTFDASTRPIIVDCVSALL